MHLFNFFLLGSVSIERNHVNHVPGPKKTHLRKRNGKSFLEHSPSCPSADLLYSADVLSERKYPIQFEEFHLNESLQFAGSGHFSVVRHARLDDGREVALKTYKILNRNSFIKELQIVKALENVSNVVKLIGVSGNKKTPTVIFSYHNSTKNGYHNVTMSDFKWWLKTLLETTKNIHAAGILHRDLRLANILTDFQNHKLTVIDFGLSEFNLDFSKNSRIGCLRLKSPELILDLRDYDCGIDIWSIGLSCLDIMIGLRGCWEAQNSDSLITLMKKYLPAESWNNFINKYFSERKDLLIKPESSGDIFELAMPQQYNLISEEILDLVGKMLEVDPSKRITAEEALKHPFFNDEK